MIKKIIFAISLICLIAISYAEDSYPNVKLPLCDNLFEYKELSFTKKGWNDLLDIKEFRTLIKDKKYEEIGNTKYQLYNLIKKLNYYDSVDYTPNPKLKGRGINPLEINPLFMRFVDKNKYDVYIPLFKINKKSIPSISYPKYCLKQTYSKKYKNTIKETKEYLNNSNFSNNVIQQFIKTKDKNFILLSIDYYNNNLTNYNLDFQYYEEYVQDSINMLNIQTKNIMQLKNSIDLITLQIICFSTIKNFSDYITATNKGPKHLAMKLTRSKLEQLIDPI
ncbi:MAG: hypothetical protein V1824_01990, partial [archaeon]